VIWKLISLKKYFSEKINFWKNYFPSNQTWFFRFTSTYAVKLLQSLKLKLCLAMHKHKFFHRTWRIDIKSLKSKGQIIKHVSRNSYIDRREAMQCTECSYLFFHITQDTNEARKSSCFSAENLSSRWSCMFSWTFNCRWLHWSPTFLQCTSCILAFRWLGEFSAPLTRVMTLPWFRYC